MKKFVICFLLFAVFIYFGGVFDSTGKFRGTKTTLRKCLDVVMWVPEQVEKGIDLLTPLDFISDVPQRLPEEIEKTLYYHFELPFKVGEEAYILYLRLDDYVDGGNGFFDGVADILLNAFIPRERYDIFTFTIVGNAYNNQWVGSQLDIKAGAHSALPRYHKIWNETLTFPDGNDYEISRTVELPYDHPLVTNPNYAGGR